jgi:L-alanine-DL-glutamate epimerase-like enolase superfamily enzyme
MKIIDVETFMVPPRWLFMKITTDAGLVGWGEPVLEGHARTMAAKSSCGQALTYLINGQLRSCDDRGVA